jgi:hypothetical protein
MQSRFSFAQEMLCNYKEYIRKELDVQVHACNPSTWDTEAEESPAGGKPGLCSETLFQKKKKKRSFITLSQMFGGWNMGSLVSQ